MAKPEYLDQLIDQASTAAGNDNQLAQMLEVGRQTIYQWRKGMKSCPVADQALMASIAGLDAAAWHARATVAQYEGTSKGDKLYRVLGKALLATGAVIATSGANAQVIYSTITEHFIRCIERSIRKQPSAHAV
jgi:hypothetical protein